MSKLRAVRFAGSPDRFVGLALAIEHLQAASVPIERWPSIYRRAVNEPGRGVPELATADQHRQYREAIEGGRELPTADHAGDMGDQVVRIMRGLPRQPIELYMLEADLHDALGKKHTSRRPAWHDALDELLRDNPRIGRKDAFAALEAAGHELPSIESVGNRLGRLRRA